MVWGNVDVDRREIEIPSTVAVVCCGADGRAELRREI